MSSFSAHIVPHKLFGKPHWELFQGHIFPASTLKYEYGMYKFVVATSNRNPIILRTIQTNMVIASQLVSFIDTPMYSLYSATQSGQITDIRVPSSWCLLTVVNSGASKSRYNIHYFTVFPTMLQLSSHLNRWTSVLISDVYRFWLVRIVPHAYVPWERNLDRRTQLDIWLKCAMQLQIDRSVAIVKTIVLVKVASSESATTVGVWIFPLLSFNMHGYIHCQP